MSNISAGLLITLIGMGLVFIALLLLWGLMDAMVRLSNRFFPDRGEEGDGADEDVDNGAEVTLVPAEAGDETDLRAQAAAAAVAVALAIKPRGNAPAALSVGSQGVSTSSWQAVHRANRLTQRLNLFSRKTGRN